MSSQSMHPLGYGDTDQIDPAVAEALTTYQVEWLFRQSSCVIGTLRGLLERTISPRRPLLFLRETSFSAWIIQTDVFR